MRLDTILIIRLFGRREGGDLLWSVPEQLARWIQPAIAISDLSESDSRYLGYRVKDGRAEFPPNAEIAALKVWDLCNIPLSVLHSDSRNLENILNTVGSLASQGWKVNALSRLEFEHLQLATPLGAWCNWIPIRRGIGHHTHIRNSK